MLSEVKYARQQDYTAKNSGQRPKKVLIEYPFDATWNLVKPTTPTEKTRDIYRFAVEAKPGEPVKLAIEEERIGQQQLALTNIDDNAIRIYRSSKAVSNQVKEALAESAKRKHALWAVETRRRHLEGPIGEINQEQARIRQNMAQLDRNSDLYKRYVKELNDQEDQLAKLRSQISDLTGEQTQLRNSLDEYLTGLDVK